MSKAARYTLRNLLRRTTRKLLWRFIALRHSCQAWWQTGIQNHSSHASHYSHNCHFQTQNCTTTTTNNPIMNPETPSVPNAQQSLTPIPSPETVPPKNEIPVQEWHRNGTVLSSPPDQIENLLQQVTALTEKPLPQNFDQAMLTVLHYRIFDLACRPNLDPRLIELLVAIFLKLKNYEATNPKSKARPDVFGNPNGGIPAETLARIERQLHLM